MQLLKEKRFLKKVKSGFVSARNKNYEACSKNCDR